MKPKPPVPEDLSADEQKRLIAWMRERQEKYGDFDWIEGPRELRREVDACLAFHGSTGNKHGYSDWYRVCQRWLVNAQRFRERDRQAGRRESFVNLDGPARLRVVK